MGGGVQTVPMVTIASCSPLLPSLVLLTLK
jgi:hypothetical protein